MIPEFINSSSTTKGKLPDVPPVNDPGLPSSPLNNEAFQQALRKQSFDGSLPAVQVSDSEQPDVVPDRQAPADSLPQNAAQSSESVNVAYASDVSALDPVQLIEQVDQAIPTTKVPVTDHQQKPAITVNSAVEAEQFPALTFPAPDPASENTPDPGTLPSLNRQPREPAAARQADGQHPGNVEPPPQTFATDVELDASDFLLPGDIYSSGQEAGITSTEPSLKNSLPVETVSPDIETRNALVDRLPVPTLPSLRPDVTLTAIPGKPGISEAAVENVPDINDELLKTIQDVGLQSADSALPDVLPPIENQSVSSIVEATLPLSDQSQYSDIVDHDSLPQILPSLPLDISRDLDTAGLQQSDLTPSQSTFLESTAGLELRDPESDAPQASVHDVPEQETSASPTTIPSLASGKSAADDTAGSDDALAPEYQAAQSTNKDTTNKATVSPVVPSSPADSVEAEPAIPPKSIASPISPDTDVVALPDSGIQHSTQPEATSGSGSRINESDAEVYPPNSENESNALPRVTARAFTPPVSASSSSPDQNSIALPHAKEGTQPEQRQLVRDDVTVSSSEPVVEAVRKTVENSVATRDSETQVETTAGPVRKSKPDSRAVRDNVVSDGNSGVDVTAAAGTQVDRAESSTANSQSAIELSVATSVRSGRIEPGNSAESRSDASRIESAPRDSTLSGQAESVSPGRAETVQQVNSSIPQLKELPDSASGQVEIVLERSNDSSAKAVTPTVDSGANAASPISAEAQAANVVSAASAQEPTMSTPAASTNAGSQTEASREQAVPIEIRDAVSAIQDAASSNGRIRVRLNPRELGSLFVDVTRSDSGIVARLEVENAAARVAVMETLPDLQKSLSRSGAAVDRIDVVVSELRAETGRQEGDQSQQKEQQSSRQDRQASDQRQAQDEQNERRRRRNQAEHPSNNTTDVEQPTDFDIKL